MAIPKFKCTCPDFSGTAPANPAASAISQQIDRDWSNKGTSMSAKSLYCKHIWRVVIELGLIDQVGVPSDLRFPGLEKYQPPSDKPKMQKSLKMGDDFGF